MSPECNVHSFHIDAWSETVKYSTQSINSRRNKVQSDIEGRIHQSRQEGRVLYHPEKHLNSGSINKRTDTKTLPGGMYHIEGETYEENMVIS